MEFLVELWLPILLSAVFVFVVSSIMHMLIPIHRGDFGRLPGEEQVLEGLRSQSIKPGEYMFPFMDCSKDTNSDELKEKFIRGPVGFMTVMPSGPWKMGKSLVQWFLYALLVSFFTAYIAALALEPGAEYLAVFRVTGAIAVLAYAFSNIPNSIWKGVSWGTTLKFVFDGVVYGLVTAGTFGWLWG